MISYFSGKSKFLVTCDSWSPLQLIFLISNEFVEDVIQRLPSKSSAPEDPPPSHNSETMPSRSTIKQSVGPITTASFSPQESFKFIIWDNSTPAFEWINWIFGLKKNRI